MIQMRIKRMMEKKMVRRRTKCHQRRKGADKLTKKNKNLELLKREEALLEF